MHIGTYSVDASTTVAQLKTMMLGQSGLGNEDMLSIYFGGAVLGDGSRVLDAVGNGGTAVVRFGPAATEGGRRRRRNTRRRKNTRRY